MKSLWIVLVILIGCWEDWTVLTRSNRLVSGTLIRVKREDSSVVAEFIQEKQLPTFRRLTELERSNQEISKLEKSTNEEEEKIASAEIRTATGGIVNTIMILLTIVACIGNGAFLVYVFWFSK